MEPKRWNHNIHYHPVLLDLLPAGPVGSAPGQAVLDVGCGEGMLTRSLAEQAEQVVGIDHDESSIRLARSTRRPNVEYVHGDVMTHPFELDSFDLVVSVASLHHIGTVEGFQRFRELVKPGGQVGVIGLARTRLPRDLAYQLAGAVATRAQQLSRRTRAWEHSAPLVWPPEHSFADVRRIAAHELPGCDFRRHVLWRYTLTWTKPG